MIRLIVFSLLLITSAQAQATSNLIAVDGDTVKSAVDGTYYRLLGYDTPEIMHAKCEQEHVLGLKAKTIMQEIVIEGQYKLVPSGKKDKYGRGLATLYTRNTTTDKIFIQAGLAYAYFGRGPKKNWCLKQ